MQFPLIENFLQNPNVATIKFLLPIAAALVRTRQEQFERHCRDQIDPEPVSPRCAVMYRMKCPARTTFESIRS